MEMRPVGCTSSTAAPTILGTIESESPIRLGTAAEENDESSLTAIGSPGVIRADSSDEVKAIFGFAFEVDLRASRPYRRAMKRRSLFSPRSSGIGTVGWSCLSDLSLADVSELSVINLPISATELWNGQRYSNSHLVIKGILEDISEEEIRCEHPIRSESRMGAISRIGSISHPLIANYNKIERQPLKAIMKLFFGNEGLDREGLPEPRIRTSGDGVPVATLPKKIVLLGTC